MKTRVLVVDDSPLIRAVLREAFERTHDIEVIGEAADGRRAVELVQELSPDVVTMDIIMPVMDGLAATAEIMRVRPTPIVIIARTNNNAQTLAIEALAKGALELFPKPPAGFDDHLACELAVMIRKVAREIQIEDRRVQAAPSPESKIRVMIVDDSSLVRQVLRSMLGQLPDIEVVAEASDGMTAVKLAADIRPDVVCLDLLMPIMGGYETAQRILRKCSPGILVVSKDGEDARSLLKEHGTRSPMEVFLKPVSGFDEVSQAALVSAIRRLAIAAGTTSSCKNVSERRPIVVEPGKVAIVGIVGSTGAPRVLQEIMRGLPKDFPVPIVIVQHTERGFSDPMAAWLSSVSTLPVRLGRAEQVLVPGEIVIAPDSMHMEIHTGGLVKLHKSAPVDGFCPSGTVLLNSLAANFGQHALGLVLSGMGSDGAEGLGAIYAAGGCAIVEDPDTASVSGMPRRALERATGAFVDRASRLAWLLIEIVGSGLFRKIA